MSKIALSPHASGTGVFTIQSPNSNTDRTLVLPDEAGTVLTSASSITAQAMNGPVFKARPLAKPTINHNTTTKVTLDNERIDTDGCYDTGLYRFTPTVAGYYQVNINVDAEAVSGRSYYFSVQLQRNGTLYAEIEHSGTGNASGRFGCTSGDIVLLNGSTDYIECWLYMYDYSAASSILLNTQTYFSGALVRAV